MPEVQPKVNVNENLFSSVSRRCGDSEFMKILFLVTALFHTVTDC